MNKYGLLLLLGVAVGILAIVLVSSMATHASQAPASHATNATGVQSPPPNPWLTEKAPPSLFSGAPCQRCLLGHARFWSG